MSEISPMAVDYDYRYVRVVDFALCNYRNNPGTDRTKQTVLT